MAADVSTRDLVTRDFLSYAVIGSKELDLDIKVPSGWERRLDLLSGETYLEKTGSKSKNQLHDLNLPPPQNDNSTLDLKLLLPSCPRPNYQSVCTIDKVRSALERAGRTSQGNKRTDGPDSSTSSSTKRSLDLDETTDGSDSLAGFMAAGCPSCLMYVLISKGNPRCPRCDLHVPAPAEAMGAGKKKAKFDLNLL